MPRVRRVPDRLVAVGGIRDRRRPRESRLRATGMGIREAMVQSKLAYQCFLVIVKKIGRVYSGEFALNEHEANELFARDYLTYAGQLELHRLGHLPQRPVAPVLRPVIFEPVYREDQCGPKLEKGLCTIPRSSIHPNCDGTAEHHGI